MVICFPFIGDSIGGSHISSLLLIDQLQKKGMTVCVIVHSNGMLIRELRKRGIEPEVLQLEYTKEGMKSRKGNLAALVRAFHPIHRYLGRRRPDIVHTNDMRAQIIWSLPCRAASVKHIWHQRTAFSDSTLSRLLVRGADRVVCISNYVKSTCPRRLKPARITVVANAVKANVIDRDNVNEIRRGIVGHEENRRKTRIIGVFGSLTSVKKPITAVRAASEAARITEQPVICMFAGNDKQNFRDRIRKVGMEAGYLSKIVFQDFVSPIEPWISACDLVIACSETDGFGRVLIECLSLGVPVVASKAGGHVEILVHEQTGMLAQPCNPKDMAECAKILWNDDALRQQIIENGRKIARTTFSPRRQLESIMGLYSEVSP